MFDNISISHTLTKAMKIKLLNRPKDWVDWNKQLQGIFGLARFWKVFTREFTKPINHDTDKLAI